jgi:hypothetical protein
MMQSDVHIVLTSSDRLREAIRGTERDACLQAEEIIRAWYTSGRGIGLEIQARDTDTRTRVYRYLLELSAELQIEARSAQPV